MDAICLHTEKFKPETQRPPENIYVPKDFVAYWRSAGDGSEVTLTSGEKILVVEPPFFVHQLYRDW